MSLENIQTFAANVTHAVKNHEKVHIGGGEFNSEELKSVAIALQEFESMRNALLNISKLLQQHRDFNVGDSTVYLCGSKAAAIVANIDEKMQTHPDESKIHRRPRGPGWDL